MTKSVPTRKYMPYLKAQEHKHRKAHGECNSVNPKGVLFVISEQIESVLKMNTSGQKRQD